MPCVTTPALELQPLCVWTAPARPSQSPFHFYLSTTSDELESKYNTSENHSSQRDLQPLKDLRQAFQKRSQGLELDGLLLTQTFGIHTLFSEWPRPGSSKGRGGSLVAVCQMMEGHTLSLAICTWMSPKGCHHHQWCNSLRLCHNKVLFLIKKTAPCVFRILQDYLKSQKWTRRHPRSFENEEFSW